MRRGVSTHPTSNSLNRNVQGLRQLAFTFPRFRFTHEPHELSDNHGEMRLKDCWLKVDYLEPVYVGE